MSSYVVTLCYTIINLCYTCQILCYTKLRYTIPKLHRLTQLERHHIHLHGSNSTLTSLTLFSKRSCKEIIRLETTSSFTGSNRTFKGFKISSRVSRVETTTVLSLSVRMMAAKLLRVELTRNSTSAKKNNSCVDHVTIMTVCCVPCECKSMVQYYIYIP